MSSEITTKVSYYERFYNTIDPELKEAVNNGFKKAEAKLDPSLFQNINVHFAANFDYLTCDTYSQKILSKYPECKNLYGFFNTVEDKSIYLQEKRFTSWPHIFDTPLTPNAKERLEHAAMHELGHLFDTYYVDTNPELQKKHKELCYKMDIEQKELTEEEAKLLIEYFNNDSYSDSDEFKEALIKDLGNLKNRQQIVKYRYFLQDFFGKADANQKVKNFTIEKSVEEGFVGRSEVFAQLFSYAIGTDDGNKNGFTNLFKNSYKIVQEYINKHSK